jgi:hypothetical protein
MVRRKWATWWSVFGAERGMESMPYLGSSVETSHEIIFCPRLFTWDDKKQVTTEETLTCSYTEMSGPT